VEASPTDRRLPEDRDAVKDVISANNLITESSDSDINVFFLRKISSCGIEVCSYSKLQRMLPVQDHSWLLLAYLR
jgi:hypothetical protein